MKLSEINKRDPYMVFCHEWSQAGNGTVCGIELSPDLKKGGERTVFNV